LADEEKTLKRIKSGLFNRSLSLTKLAIQSSASIAKSGIKGVFMDGVGKEAQFKVMLEAQAKLLAHELGHLKGSLMKVGQMMALYGEHFLPEEVVSALKTLNENSIAVGWPEIDRLLKQRLSTEQLAELDIETKPLAAASMGQVHRARIKATGETICLKIQYPGVDAAIDTDIKALRSILGMFRFIPTHSQGYEALFQEIREMLKQELDYESEARFTDQARQLMGGRSEFVLPRIYLRYSTPQILATSYEPGVNIDSPEVQSLSEERRAQLGEAYSRLFLRELFEYRMMQTDPHFGNYKVRIQDGGIDQLILLDWGAVQQFSEDFIGRYKDLVLGAWREDRDLIIKGGLGIGFLKPDDPDKMKDAFVAITNMAIEPWLPPRDHRVPAHLVDGKGRYMWSRSDLPSRITTLATKYALSFKLRPPPREVLFLDRKIGGVFIVMKILDARFQGHKIFEEEVLRRWEQQGGR
jgi:predicted unusual protein kinase regulating ubiquinone biosynthesis (AarF/ABC1/UbiB family)